MGVLRQMPQHVAHLPRTGFDMSQSFAFTSSTGMILPVYQDILNVGETVYLNGELFSRTQPLVNAAMADVDVYLDWFFVPIPMLYQLFTSLRWQTNDYFSSAFESGITADGTFLPLYDMTQLYCIGNYGKDTDQIFSIGGMDNNYECYGKQTFRLLNHLGFNPYAIFHGDNTSYYANSINPDVFPLFPLAYQAIFQDYFRIEDYEKRNVLSCNFDKYYDQQSTLAYPTSADGIFQLRYRPRHKDYFTSVKANPMVSAMNLLDGDNINPSEILTKVDNFLSDNTFGTATAKETPLPLNAGSLNSDKTQVRVLDWNLGYQNVNNTNTIRSLFAVEKLLRIIGRSKKDYDSQVLAHFGFKVPHDVKHQLTHLFEQHALLHIGEVASTADTTASGGVPVGEVAGKGYINVPQLRDSKGNPKPYKFTAPVDGVVMCVYSSVPRFRYYNTFDKQNAITSRLDFFTPEFDKLGMQPLYSYEADVDEIGTANRFGWQHRYQQHKQKYDRVSEAFLTASNGANYYASWVLAHKPFFGYGAGVGNFYPPKLSSFYSSPCDINSIMVVDYSPLWSSSFGMSPYEMFDTDPFINDFKASVKKVSTMSTTGEPDL